MPVRSEPRVEATQEDAAQGEATQEDARGAAAVPRHAAIDIGTNTVLLTVAEASPAGEPPSAGFRVLSERHDISRLGEGVDRTGELSQAAIARTLAILESYRAVCDQEQVTGISCVATSALRDARASEAFRARAERILGAPVEIISGQREASLTFQGALTDQRVSADTAEPLIAFDVGGGSTELIAGAPDGRIDDTASLQVGSVRLFERYGTDWRAVRRAIEQAIHAENPRWRSLAHDDASGRVLGIAGTVTTLWSLAHRRTFDEDAARDQELTLRSVHEWMHELKLMSATRRLLLPGMMPGRADVIVHGALITLGVLEWLGARSCIATARGVRHGLLAEHFMRTCTS